MTTARAHLAAMLSRVERRVSDRVRVSVLDAAGLTVEQWRVMCCLSDVDGQSMSSVAEFAAVPTATLTRIVDKLVENALVYRQVDKSDRRRVMIFLSVRGVLLQREVEAKVRCEERRIAGHVGPEEDAEQLLALLHRLDERLGADPV